MRRSLPRMTIVLTLVDLHLEELLDRVFDLDLVRVARDLEDDLVVLLAEQRSPSR